MPYKALSRVGEGVDIPFADTPLESKPEGSNRTFTSFLHYMIGIWIIHYILTYDYRIRFES